MPIRCVCPNGHALRVKDKLAGKSGVCPKCGANFDVPNLPAAPAPSPAEARPPAETAPPGAQPTANQPTTPRPATPPPAAVVPPAAPAVAVEWRLARPDGQQFGPVDPAGLAGWIAEGRVQPDWLVWRSDWPDWRRADAPDADLPAPLPLMPPVETPTPPPVAVAPPGPPSEASPSGAAPTETPSEADPPASLAEAPRSADVAYNRRRIRAARQRRNLIIGLGVVCVALVAMLVWLVYFR